MPKRDRIDSLDDRHSGKKKLDAARPIKVIVRGSFQVSRTSRSWPADGLIPGRLPMSQQRSTLEDLQTFRAKADSREAKPS